MTGGCIWWLQLSARLSWTRRRRFCTGNTPVMPLDVERGSCNTLRYCVLCAREAGYTSCTARLRCSRLPMPRSCRHCSDNYWRTISPPNKRLRCCDSCFHASASGSLSLGMYFYGDFLLQRWLLGEDFYRPYLTERHRVLIRSISWMNDGQRISPIQNAGQAGYQNHSRCIKKHHTNLHQQFVGWYLELV